MKEQENQSVDNNSSSNLKKRIDSVDLLRGLIMIFMALDHARYPYFSNLTISPEDINQTYPALFLTRWITHFCAPLFFLLAGTGAYLSLASGKTVRDISRFFWTRGLWLIFLEMTVIAFAWSFNFTWRFGGVIWALGWSMLLMALLVRLPLILIAIFGIGIITLHNLLDGINSSDLGSMGWFWTFFHSIGNIRIESFGYDFFILYALIPWVGIMAAGFVLGVVFTYSQEKRLRFLFITGTALILGFIILRATNFYGDQAAFQIQESFSKTFIAFLNTSKYPASLQFILMTIGPALILLAWFEKFDYKSVFGWFGQKILVFGRVPMFYYILHIFLLHLLAIAVGLINGQSIGWLLGEQKLPVFRQIPAGYGYELPFVYLMTFLSIVLLYFPCRWFEEVKRKRREWWLKYL